MRGLACMVVAVWLLTPAWTWSADLTNAEGVRSYCERVSPEVPEAVRRAWSNPCGRAEGGEVLGTGDALSSEDAGSMRALEAALRVVGLAVGMSSDLLCGVTEPEEERGLLGDWIRERHGWLLAVHHLDVVEPSVEAHDDLGLVVARHPAILEAGGGVSRLWVGAEGRVAFEPGPALQEEVQRLHLMGDLVMRLEVMARSVDEPSVPGGRAYCLRREEGGWDVHGRVVGAVLVDGTTGEELVRAGGLSREQGVPVAEVTSLDVEGGQACPPRESGLMRLAVEGVANRCYAESLLASGVVRGALVVGLEVSPEGTTDGVRVLIDVLQHPPLTACLVSELSRTRLPRLDGGGAIRVRTVLTFTMAAEATGGDPALASPAAAE